MCKLIYNKETNTLKKFLSDKILPGSKINIIVSKLSIFALYALKDEIEKSNDVKILITKMPTYIDDEKNFRRYNIGEQSESYNKYELQLVNKLNVSYISRIVVKLIESKISIKRVIDGKNIPSQIRIDDDFLISNMGKNLDSSELGIMPSSNYFPKIVNTDADVIKNISILFESMWYEDSSLNLKDDFINQIKKLYKENSPKLIYYFTLYNIFNNQLDELDNSNVIKSGTGFEDSKIWNTLYQFQKDGVVGLIEKINKYNGAILADSVGLGKTYSALAVIKYYELRNEKVLVLSPKRLRDNWTVYIKNDIRNNLIDDKFNYDVLNHTDLSRYDGNSGEINLNTINWGNYDLIVIDESHNFRNNYSKKSENPTRYQRLMDDVIKSGVNTKVLMLTATPVNNRMTDIKNQIAFITKGNNSALSKYGIDDINLELRKAQKYFNNWSKFNYKNRTTNNFLKIVNPGYFKILDLLTIARSRKHIEKYYQNDGMNNFPKRLKPINIKSDIDVSNEFLNLKDLNEKIGILNLSLYKPTLYIKSSKKNKYRHLYDTDVKNSTSKFTQEDRENALTGLIRVNLLKRMESSIHSFQLTLKRIINSINSVLSQLKNDMYFQSIDDFYGDRNDFDNIFDDEQMIGKKIRILIGDIDSIKWRNDLLDDLLLLNDIYKSAEKINPERDAKLLNLKKIISNKIDHPINYANNKIVIFTAFSDTAEYLYDNLKNYVYDKYKIYTGLITGSKGQKTNLPSLKINDMNDILINFSPNSKNRNKIYPNINDDIDILIATDTISEGQNLQDADYLINYDIHWNPVKIIQRFGRIDRIGSNNKVIQLVNFWPNMELDEYIKLENRVKNRMVIMNTTATGEDDVLNDSKENLNEMNDLEYRRNQMKKLQNESLNIEDINGAISITDINFSDFKVDLMNKISINKDELSSLPKGIFSITKSSFMNNLEPGAIFILKSKNIDSKNNNVIFPYYISYIDINGNVKVNYSNAYKVLSIMKKIAKPYEHVFSNLVDKFNKNTNYGKNMSIYTSIMQKMIDNINNINEQNTLNSLFSPEDTINDKKDIILNDFELIAFLIIEDDCSE